jgi:hypothetical protein
VFEGFVPLVLNDNCIFDVCYFLFVYVFFLSLPHDAAIGEFRLGKIIAKDLRE